MPPFWMTAFLDFTGDAFPADTEFWSAVTGYSLSAPRGAAEEFGSLVPSGGAAYLKVQRLADGPSRIHLDLHVGDVRAAADTALAAGSTELADHGDRVVQRSPAGIVLCFVDHPGGEVPAPAQYPGGATRVDQVCLDVPAADFDREGAFWSAITGRELQRSRIVPGFRILERPADQPLRLLLQPIDEGAAGAHLDLAVEHRTAEVARHVAAGAVIEQVHPRWTVLIDPTGVRYCVTDRAPS